MHVYVITFYLSQMTARVLLEINNTPPALWLGVKTLSGDFFALTSVASVEVRKSTGVASSNLLNGPLLFLIFISNRNLKVRIDKKKSPHLY